MNDADKTSEVLIGELREVRRRLRELEERRDGLSESTAAQRESALKESEALFRTVLENSRDLL
jgi:hypothetical protein